ncbi:site-specific integrase [Schinkia azotoformans]|uniref:site-specific integrase n=1 Tax=Schinkia azotoformans TaxID=1454 RepID=UPI002E205C21|nr:site-specific integrase [Schinkia azotoformans]
MKTTDFSYHLSDYLTKYLPGIAGLSMNTIMSYRDMFKLLLEFYETEQKIKPEKIRLIDLKKEIIEDYLNWLEQERNCSISTRNVRLAAIHAFVRYLQRERTEFMFQSQQLLSIPFKKTKKSTIEYLTLDAIKLLLNLPDKKTALGRRDTVLLSLLYDTGARVQEICDLTVSDIRIESPSIVKISGKGNKIRIVPIMAPMSNLLKQYIKENGLNNPLASNYPLFFNRSKGKLTREGIAYIVKKYVNLARNKSPELFPNKVSPHCFRHSKAMHLLQAGVNLVYIRDLLGHVDIKTTEIYARIDGEMKRRALEKGNNDVIANKLPEWQRNKELMNWLKGLGK